MSSREKLTIEVVDDVDANDIINLLVNAFDSGATGYWAARAEVELPEDFDIYSLKWLKDPDSWAQVRKVYIAPFVDGGRVVLFGHGDDGEDGERFILDFKAIEQGVQVMARDYPNRWADFRCQNDDSETGDIFVQCCVFGEVIYG